MIQNLVRHEFKGDHRGLNISATPATSLVIPITEHRGQLSDPGHAYAKHSLILYPTHACCSLESLILVPFVYPLALLQQSNPMNPCPNTDLPPTLPALKAIFSVVIPKQKIQSGRITWVHFFPKRRLCCVLASLPNEFFIVAPYEKNSDENSLLWAEMQYVDGKILPQQSDPKYETKDIDKELRKIFGI